MNRIPVALACVVPALACAQSSAAPQVFESQLHRFRAVTLTDDLDHPWGLAFLPDGRMLVTERPGRLRIAGQDGTLSDPIAGVPEVDADGQGGLLDVALAPDFAQSRLIYLSFAEPGEGGSGTSVARARLAESENRLEGLQVIFRQEPKVEGGAHFGSRLVFARDGNLFITTGDRQHRPFVQDLSKLQGKVVRVRPDGTIPPDNPFVNRAGARPEIWSYGHRNLQGAALHPETGQLWTVEHGARGGDELNAPKAGRNYGWPVITYGVDYSGARIGVGQRKEGMEQPIHYWDPSIAPSGLMFYTGDKFPSWKGNAFVGALGFQLLARLVLDGEHVRQEERLLEGYGQRIRAVVQGPDGFIYLLTDDSDGRIVRLEPIS
ncbi:MAG TPA: PQQ-dependent sugar dehydrogenase [Gemmatimonadales bacterium]|nr:PQQ-dependent sugar dehydrogenase [Gemmatimonadales bacterium]